MADFTPWTLFIDLGIVATLLLLGQFIRAKVRWVQQLFIPPSLIAGFIGLAFGPGGLGWIPLSHHTGTYAGILIAFIFACLPFSSAKSKENRTAIGKMWVYSQVGMLWQWAFGGLLGLFVLTRFWNVDEAFGISMPCGFCGGHGTAAAIGHAFASFGFEDMLTLSMTAATVGIVASVIIGLLLVKWGTRKGHTAFLTDFAALPDELRSGLLPTDKREELGQTTTSSISIDSLTFNFIVIALAAFCGYGVSKLVAYLVPGLEMPVFSCAFVCGILLKLLFDKTGATSYVSAKTVGHLSGTFTDLLVAFGIASIKLSVVMQYLVPIIILLTCGLLVTLIYVLVVARKMMRECWFEKAMFTWGWFTGTMAMGIALLRVVDPKMKSHCLEDYALAYLFIAPVEISLITFAPLAFVNGYGWLFLLTAFLLGAALMCFAYKKGWFKG